MDGLIIDDITAHLALPLPHPQNDQQDDVLRLRDAFSAIDAKFAGLDLLLASDDLDLDQLQELVNAIKANHGDAVALLASKAGRDELAAVIADKASRAELASVAAAAFPPPAIEITANTNLEVNKLYHLNSSAGSFEVVLPPNPPQGSWIWLVDAAGACATNPVTVRGNGKPIRNVLDDLLLDLAGDSPFLFHNSNKWTEQ